jgi:uncharacterized membrane protein YphA (DoxX/SURF4 family)
MAGMARQEYMSPSILTHLLRFGLGGIFVYAGIVKAVNPSSFLEDIESYRLLSYHVAVALSLYLPWLEIICGILLVVSRMHRVGSISILVVLMGIFTAALSTAWVRGLDISCGCFGDHGGRANYPLLLARDAAIFGVLVVIIPTDRSPQRSNTAE